MITITREELKEKLDRGEDFKLINCLDDWMFRAKRWPTDEMGKSVQSRNWPSYRRTSRNPLSERFDRWIATFYD
jgi:hypothetical protein